MERLQKIIANSGFCSRRKAEELITKGLVRVNGEKVTDLGTKAKASDIITIAGKTLKNEDKEYILLYKPRGVVSTTSDDKGRKTVISLIDTDKRLYPIGRLDYDTSGLLILTNDGELTNLLTHPKNEITKELDEINKEEKKQQDNKKEEEIKKQYEGLTQVKLLKIFNYSTKTDTKMRQMKTVPIVSFYNI